MTTAEHRYVPEELPVDAQGRTLWGVWDRKLGVLVETDGELERFPNEDRAAAWCARDRYLDQVGPHLRS